MQRHKELYKEQSLVLSPRNHCQENRNRLQAARAKKREDCFYQNRIISVSPTPVKTKPAVVSQEIVPQENVVPIQELEQLQHNKDTVEHSGQSNPKATRQKLYLQRYMEWKANKNKEHKQQEQTRRGTAINVPLAKQSNAFPKSQTFRAPDNLPTTKEKESASVFQPGKRLSLYVIANPIGKTKGTALEAKMISTPAPAVNQPMSTASLAAKATSVATSLSKTSSKPVKVAHSAKSLTTALVRHKAVTPASNPVPAARQTTNPVALARQKAAARPLTTAPCNATTRTTNLRSRQPTIDAKKVASIPRSTPAALSKEKTAITRQQKQTVRIPVSTAPRTARLKNGLSKPVETPSGNRGLSFGVGGRVDVTKPQPIRARGAVGKFKDSVGMTSKTAANSIRMKATNQKSQYTKLQENVRKIPQLKAELLQAATEELPPNTPLEDVLNPLMESTSTVCRTNNVTGSLLDAFGGGNLLSPVAPAKSEDTTVKRQLLPAGNTAAPVSAAKKKFDFTRYSVAKSPAEGSLILDPQQLENSKGESTLVPDEQKTPPRRESSGMPNYLSPYVSVSRGKVNSRCEKEKRNSFYLPGEESPLEVRRAIESVLYFRLQLENEIARLQGLCNEWEAHSKENEARLLETGGIDMINVTIGQTRLLTTKKMMQFSSLIDRCEAGATGKNSQPNDGSEDTKPVQAEDLEGWWDMLRLQSENVDKRFENLKRWKANDWLDPDAVTEEPKQQKPKISRNMKIKSKAKPSSNLQQFLRKAHANMKKNKVEEPSTDGGIASTSSRLSSPRVIVVRNRRSFSPARTVLRMSTGEGRQSIAPNALLKSAILAAAEQNIAKTPPPKPRTSILKTPGTTKRQNRGVLFSAKKSVRRFEFTYEEGNISNDEIVGADKLEDCEEDMSLEASTERRSMEQDPETSQASGQTPRTYTLRNRRVNLRPSSEFM
ncbi:guanylate kinase-associated protein mars [Drosophila eugracilis]|uniref:guanylate kinase-associated protein mars n=1 Tax=Drosophila eugracilis TaxID=29029 RepID=UPI001BDAE68C|nr:guanylate kinase-associated protein mars [Drosophila eugracilis]